MTEGIEIGDTVVLEYATTSGQTARSEVTIVEGEQHDSVRGLEGRAWADLLKGRKPGDTIVLPMPEENVLETRIVEVRRPASPDKMVA